MKPSLLLSACAALLPLACTASRHSTPSDLSSPAAPTPVAVSTSAAPSDLAEFPAMQSRFFPMLDLSAPEAQLQALPAFARSFSQYADGIREQSLKGQWDMPSQRAQAGLVLIYNALLTLHNANAVLSRRLNLGDFVRERRFASANATDKDELLARLDYARQNIEQATTLRPDDRRIDSWKAGIAAVKEEVELGHITPESLEKAVQVIDARPTFNLWAAFIVFRHQPAESAAFGSIVDKAKAFVNTRNSGKDACAERPEDCLNGVHAPYNSQASISMLGDAFLKRANALLQNGDVRGAMELAHYAKGTYGALQSNENKDATAKWQDRSALTLRLAAVNGILTTQKPFDGAAFLHSNDYQKVYECASCHGRVGDAPMK